MSTVGVTITQVDAQVLGSTSVLPVEDGRFILSAKVASGAGSVAAGFTVPTTNRLPYFWHVTLDAGAAQGVWANFGPHGSVTAAVGTGFFVPAGGYLSLKAWPGDDCAVIDDA